MKQRQFPTEAAACFVGARKVTSEAVGDIRFWAHRRLALESLCTPTKWANSILTTVQFDEIAWEFISTALRAVPRMFQLWASKQVWDITGTNSLRSKWDNTVSPWCPSCKRWNETSGHILLCREKGWAMFWQTSVDLLDNWLKDTGTDPMIRHAVVHFARERGRRTMSEILSNMDTEEYHRTMAIDGRYDLAEHGYQPRHLPSSTGCGMGDLSMGDGLGHKAPQSDTWPMALSEFSGARCTHRSAANGT